MQELPSEYDPGDDFSTNRGNWGSNDYQPLSRVPRPQPKPIAETQSQGPPLQENSARRRPTQIPRLTNEQWILDRPMMSKLNLIAWLIDNEPNACNKEGSCKLKNTPQEPLPEYQTFDGFFNNLFKVDLGAVG